MRSWKRRTQYQYKARYRIWNESDAEHNHVSKWGKRRFPSYEIGSWEGWGHPSWRKQRKLKNRKRIKVIDTGLAQFRKYPYFEDCRSHPCRVVQLHPDYNMMRLDVDGESLINSTSCSCSYFHCGIVHLTEEDGFERAKFANDMGMLPYQLKYIQHDVSDVFNFIAYDLGMESIFKFSETSKVEYITEAGRLWLALEHGVDFKTISPMTEVEMKNYTDKVGVS